MKLSASFFPEILKLEEAPILNRHSIEIGWHASAFGAGGVLSSGLSRDRETARRVAIAEHLEIRTFEKLYSNQSSDEFLTSQFPTSCGFAAGFQREKVRLRAISESIERWTWSKWIDEHYKIPEVTPAPSELSELSQYFLSHFENVHLYQLKLDTTDIPNYFESACVGIVVAEKDGGVFPGSRVNVNDKDLWEHALLEAWRHLKIHQLYKDKENLKTPYNRIVYFGSHRDEAFRAIDCAIHGDWPKPAPRILKEIDSDVPGVFIFRSLMKDYIGWHCGGYDRFVY